MRTIILSIASTLFMSSIGFAQNLPQVGAPQTVSPQKTKIRLVLKDVSFLEAKLAESCISYSSCDAIAVALPHDGLLDQFKVVVTGMTLPQAAETLSACGLKTRLANKVFDLETKTALNLSDATSVIAYPAVTYLTPDFYNKNAKKIQKILTDGIQAPTVAAQNLALIFGVDAKWMNMKSFNDFAPETECDVWRKVRHELEHGAQNEFAANCNAQQKRSGFENPKTREMDAFLGDAAFAEYACKGTEKIEAQLNAAGGIQEVAQTK